MPTTIVIQSSSSKWINIAFGVLTLGLLLFVIGFSTNYWAVRDPNNIGLWRQHLCFRYGCRDLSTVSSNNAENKCYLPPPAPQCAFDKRDRPDWFKACQALETLGLIALLLAFIILFLYMFVESCRGRNALMAIMMCTFAGVAFVIIGVIIFNTKKGYSMYSIGWSMGLAIAGAIFSFISGIMVVMGYLGK